MKISLLMPKDKIDTIMPDLLTRLNKSNFYGSMNVVLDPNMFTKKVDIEFAGVSENLIVKLKKILAETGFDELWSSLSYSLNDQKIKSIWEWVLPQEGLF